VIVMSCMHQVDALIEPLSRKGPGMADKRYGDYPQIRATTVQ